MSEFSALVSPGQLVLRGEIDLATVDQLDAVLACLSGDTDVDCAALTFIGATGFRSLDRGHRAALGRGETFVVSGLDDFQRRVAAILAVPYVIESDHSASSASGHG